MDKDLLERVALARADIQSADAATRKGAVAEIVQLSEAGVPEAQYALATWKIFGVHSFEVDMDGAERLLVAASEQLFPDALYDLAVFRQKVSPGRHSKREAFGLYLLAALGGDVAALEELRRCFYRGVGVYKDIETARLIGRMQDRVGKEGGKAS